jgi:hypothetical protein
LQNRPACSNEFDVLLVTRRHLRPGEAPFPDALLAHHFHGLALGRKHTVQIRNGVPPQEVTSDTILLDIIGDGEPNVRCLDPSSVITSLKPRLLLFGTDVYAQLKSQVISPALRRSLFDTMVQYARREFFGRTDDLAKAAIAKTAIFISSLLDSSAIRENSKGIIVELISARHVDLRDDLSRFLKVYRSPRDFPAKEVTELFESFCSHFQHQHLPE